MKRIAYTALKEYHKYILDASGFDDFFDIFSNFISQREKYCRYQGMTKNLSSKTGNRRLIEDLMGYIIKSGGKH